MTGTGKGGETMAGRLENELKANGRKRSGSTEHVTEAQEYIEKHYKEKFSLKRIAGSLYVNGSYLLRLFKANTGHTLLWYHHHVRCEKAGEILADGRFSISEAGEAVGFASSSHFTHIFKKMTGKTPSEYRNDHMEK